MQNRKTWRGQESGQVEVGGGQNGVIDSTWKSPWSDLGDIGQHTLCSRPTAIRATGYRLSRMSERHINQMRNDQSTAYSAV